MKRGKMFIYVALFLLTLPLALIGNTVRAAEVPEEVTIVLHKRVFIDPKAQPELQINDGLALDEANDLANPQKTYGLNGAIFEIYDATDYIQRLQTDLTSEEIQREILNTEISVLKEEVTQDNKIGEVTTETVEGERGVAMIRLKDLTDEPRMILILEKAVKTSATIHSNTVPMLFSLPISDPMNEGEFLSTIHLYPKSTLRGRLPQTGGETPKPTPKPPGRLPQTGEAKTMIGLIGLFIVGTVSVIWFKRNSNKKTN